MIPTFFHQDIALRDYVQRSLLLAQV